MNEKTTAAPPAPIRPTIGRIVWYWREPNHAADAQPEAAIVTHVHTDSLVNLAVFDRDGGACGVRLVVLRQPGEGVPAVSYCEWMPYQQGQAAKTEAAEAAATAANNAALGGAGKGEPGAKK